MHPLSSDRASWLGDPYADTRSHYKGFAIRTRKNLLFMGQALDAGHDIHIVTQLVNSLLGVVVFPWERGVIAKMNTTALVDLQTDGWPVWDITADDQGTHTLMQFLKCFRHSVAHGNIRFDSDSRTLDEVFVEVANFPKPDKKHPNRSGPAWAARIRADHLLEFVLRLINLIELHTSPNAA